MKKPPLFISQSLIKEYLYKGDEIENRCARKIYMKFVKGLRTEPTLANAKGLLFEDLCCGTNHNNITLPKNIRTGAKLTSEKRIEEQAKIFKEWVRNRSNGNAVVNEMNSQIKIYKRWEKDRNVILSGLLDIFPFICIDDDEYIISILDLKFSGDCYGGFGRFDWKNVKYMDHIQAKMYLYLVRDIDYDLNDALNPGNHLRELTAPIRELLDMDTCQFRYYIGDDKPNYQSRAIRYKLKHDDMQRFHEDIRKVVYMLREDNEAIWPANPGIQCLGDAKMGVFKCPYLECDKRKLEQEI